MPIETFKIEVETKENPVIPEIFENEGFKNILQKAREYGLLECSSDEAAVELKNSLREGGSELVGYIMDEVNDIVKESKKNGEINVSSALFDLLSNSIRYASKPQDAEKIGSLFLNDAICLDPDGSNGRNLLEILQRIGGKENIEQLKLAAVKIIQVDKFNNDNIVIDQILTLNELCLMRVERVAETLLYIKHRLVDEKEKEIIDATLEDINDVLMEKGYQPLNASWIQSSSENIQNSNIEQRFEEEFLRHEDITSGRGMQNTDQSEPNDPFDPWEDDYGIPPMPFQEYVPPEVGRQIEDDIDIVNEVTLKDDIAPTALSAIQLHMFNFLQKKPLSDKDEIETEFNRIKKISDLEKKCAEKRNPLPTIGIEIEIPNSILTKSKVSILNSFHISNTPEIEELQEVNPDYSYSAVTQSRIIQELGHLGALPVDRENRGAKPLSMHVNFGMPKEIDEGILDKPSNQKRIKILNDLLIYAFTSTERLMSRKTNVSFNLKGEASVSQKSGHTGGDALLSRFTNIMRLELRAGEFKDKSSFRMLSESQRLVSMLISYMKYEEKLEITFAEACLADLWMTFENEVGEYLLKETLEFNLVDEKPYKAAIKIKETDLKMWSRFLVSDYSKKIGEILTEEVLSL